MSSETKYKIVTILFFITLVGFFSIQIKKRSQTLTNDFTSEEVLEIEQRLNKTITLEESLDELKKLYLEFDQQVEKYRDAKVKFRSKAVPTVQDLEEFNIASRQWIDYTEYFEERVLEINDQINKWGEENGEVSKLQRELHNK